jgi:hypothetical protein
MLGKKARVKKQRMRKVDRGDMVVDWLCGMGVWFLVMGFGVRRFGG